MNTPKTLKPGVGAANIGLHDENDRLVCQMVLGKDQHFSTTFNEAQATKRRLILAYNTTAHLTEQQLEAAANTGIALNLPDESKADAAKALGLPHWDTDVVLNTIGAWEAAMKLAADALRLGSRSKRDKEAKLAAIRTLCFLLEEEVSHG